MFQFFLAVLMAAMLIAAISAIIPWDITAVLMVLLLWGLSYVPVNDRQAERKNDQP